MKNKFKTDSLRVGFLFLIVLLNSCYVIEQGSRLLDDRTEARDIEEIIKDEKTNEKTRTFLQFVKEVKTFAHNELGLQKSQNYQKIVLTEKDHLVRVVHASEAYEMKPYTWWFPFFGESPYLGFYKDESADAEAKRLRDLNYDVYVRNVDAFSTLGVLQDPLYSFMSNYSEYGIANLIFHEETHATFWIGEDFNFNEQLATFIGDESALYFIAKRYPEKYEERVKKLAQYNEDLGLFYRDMAKISEELKKTYESLKKAGESQKLAEKQRLYREFRTDFIANYDKRYKTPYFSEVLPEEANNAFLEMYRLYTEKSDIFQRALKHQGGSIVAFIAHLKTLAKSEVKKEIERLAALPD